eukprot:2970264-Amphidinium_carterae.1
MLDVATFDCPRASTAEASEVMKPDDLHMVREKLRVFAEKQAALAHRQYPKKSSQLCRDISSPSQSEVMLASLPH